MNVKWRGGLLYCLAGQDLMSAVKLPCWGDFWKLCSKWNINLKGSFSMFTINGLTVRDLALWNSTLHETYKYLSGIVNAHKMELDSNGTSYIITAKSITAFNSYQGIFSEWYNVYPERTNMSSGRGLATTQNLTHLLSLLLHCPHIDKHPPPSPHNSCQLLQSSKPPLLSWQMMHHSYTNCSVKHATSIGQVETVRYGHLMTTGPGNGDKFWTDVWTNDTQLRVHA